MANITEEGNGYEALMAAAERMNKEKVVVAQVCNLDDETCESCSG